MLPANTIALALLGKGAMATPFKTSGTTQGGDDKALLPYDFVWVPTAGTPQNMCDSTTWSLDSMGNGPFRDDCKTFVDDATQKDNDGYWVVTGYSRNSDNWKQFATLSSCKLAVKHADGDSSRSSIPIGNQDVIDIVNDAMARYPDGATVPQLEGTMNCSFNDMSAITQWKLYA